jgi:cell division protein FtsL
MFYDRTSKNFEHTSFAPGGRLPYSGNQTQVASSQKQAASYQRPEASRQAPAARRQQPDASSQRRAVSTSRYVILLTLLCSLLWTSITTGAVTEKSLPDSFTEVINRFSSLQDRSTGADGNAAAAQYLKEKLEKLGYNDVGSYRFSVPVVQHAGSQLTLPNRNRSVELHPLVGNAVTPQTIAAPGFSGQLIYAGRGELAELNGKPVKGAILLMEMDSGKNWLHAANLGASALIYIDRGNSSKSLFNEKFELSPLQFPRFWMSQSQAREVFGDFEKAPSGQVAAEARLVSQIRWQLAGSENIYCLIEGTDPELKEKLIMVEAFYDSTATVAGLSAGADEAVGIATLLELARFLKENPPQRSVMLIASSGHAQTLAGFREMIWSISVRSKDLRHLTKTFKALIKNTRQTIKLLNEWSPVQSAADKPLDEETLKLIKEAIDQRLKSESDRVSRELMRLRLEQQNAANTEQIKKLADERLTLRRLMWSADFSDLTADDRDALAEIIPQTIADQKAILSDVRRHAREIGDARAFRSQVRAYDVDAAVSLHLSSHGDGFGAFNYGWAFPFRERIKRASIYSTLDEVLRQGAERIENELGLTGMYKDSLRPSRKRSWQSYFLDQPPLGGELTALGGIHGLTFVTTHDARARWGTPFDTPENVDMAFALKQSAVVCRLIEHLAQAPRLHDNIFPRFGYSAITGRAKFLRHGELFADQPAPGTVLLCYQGPARFYAIVDHLGNFYLRGLADKKHSYHKIIIEGYKFDPDNGNVIWTIDKNKTGKAAYRVKMYRQLMESDLVMFASNGITVFNLLEPRTFRHLHKVNILDGRRESDPLRWFMSRLDTWISEYANASIISTVFLEPGTPLKLTLSDTVLRNKLVLINSSKDKSTGIGYMVGHTPFLYRTEYQVAKDMWTLLEPRISNLERRGIFNERIRDLQEVGLTALKTAESAYENKLYDQASEAGMRSWALASRVYDDVEKTQKDVLYGVLFYIALFVPFAFCMERLLFCYANIYKRIIAFLVILILLIVLIYNVHPAFRLTYSPMVVILAFFIMGLSLMVTLIIFFRFEGEMTQLQTRAKLIQAEEMGRWKAFVAAFMLGVSNLRRRRLRTALTCATLIILTFTIMSFTAVKSMRHHARLLFEPKAPYKGFLLKNVNWRDLPHQALGFISNNFSQKGVSVPRVWLEDEDKTRTTRIPVYHNGRSFEAQGLVGLSHLEPRVSGLDDILVGGRWLAENELDTILLPERMAQRLGINPQNPQGAVVTMWGMPFEVAGVFSGKKLQQRTDLDGEPLTPATFPREVSTEMTEEELDALDSGDDVREFQSHYQHTPADLTLIIPYRSLLAAGGHLKAVAIVPQTDISIQKEAQNLVDRFGLTLFSGEPDGTYLYHASDTMSYSGVPNIIIPIIISVFIVLNTMIGSVYERKREIGIYTSVGLAPSHVSFLFIAEAMALAVISVVLGYLVAQTSAKLFAETALWSGITVNYSSWAGVAAMLLVIIVVLVSVLYPSKVAGEIAIPDVNRAWTLPEALGNVIEVNLPFYMSYAEHRSIGGFLLEYFQGHQDVSHGLFSTGDIQFGFICQTAPVLASEDDDCPQQACEYDACLQMRASVWLAPFDFGINQKVDLQFCPAADEPGFLEIKVRLMRESGEANAWHRINKGFLHNIRKQLLLWRSFDLPTKEHYERLLAEAEKEMGLDTR